MIQWKIAWREMRQHVGRTVLTLLSIVVGVGAVMAVSMSTGSARRAYRQMFQVITGRAALEITSTTGQPMSVDLLAKARAVSGVLHAVPLIQRPTIMYHGTGRLKLVAMGIDPRLDAAVRDFELVEGQSLAEAKGVLLEASLARSLKLTVGSRVRLLSRRGRIHAKVVGLVQPRTGAAVTTGSILFLPLAAAQHYFKMAGQVDRIQIVPAPDSDGRVILAELQRQLPAGTEVQPPPTHSPLAEQTMKATEGGLQMATAFSLLSAVFIIMNSFLMSVGQRRRQLSILRAIGATRRQVGGLIAREAVLLAIGGTTLGVAVGWFGAMELNAGMSSLFQTTLPPIELRWGPLMTAVAFGLGVSLIGAALPAYRAALCTPMEGMTGKAIVGKPQRVWLSSLVGAATILIGLLEMLAPRWSWLPNESTVVGAVTILVGLVWLVPLVLFPLIKMAHWIVRPIAALESRLAVRQLLRHRTRTTLTIGVLFVAVATGLGLASSVLDNVADVRSWYRAVITGDLFVRAAMPDLETGLTAAVPDGFAEQLQSIDGVQRINAIRIAAVTVDDQRAMLIASGTIWGDPVSEAKDFIPFRPPPGREVLIGSVLAQRLNYQAGDFVTLQTSERAHRLRIHEVANDYSGGGLTIHMNLELADQLFGMHGVDALVIKARNGRLSDVEMATRRICDQQGLVLQTYTDLTQMIEGMMAGLVASLWALMVLGLIVAAIGVINTLSMNVLEQTREWGLLRVIGMTRGQVRRSIVAQAIMLGLLGIVPGTLVGMILAFVINSSTLPVIGHAIEFHTPITLTVLGFAAAMIMVLISAWVPAERAARMELGNALRYE